MGLDYAAGAPGADGAAEVLAVEDQKGVYPFPVFFGQYIAQDHFGFFRRFCTVPIFGTQPAAAVGYAVDMDVNADAGEIKGFD